MPSLIRLCSARNGCANERCPVSMKSSVVPTIDMYDISAGPAHDLESHMGASYPAGLCVSCGRKQQMTLSP